MSINPRILLPINRDRHIPRPQVCDKLAVCFAGVVELAEVVALPVRSHFKSWQVFLTAGKVDAPREAVVVCAVDRVRTKEVLSRSLETSLETACKCKNKRIRKRNLYTYTYIYIYIYKKQTYQSGY